jgi:hypothetical protein
MDVGSLVEKAGQNYLFTFQTPLAAKAYFGHPVTLAPLLFDILCKLGAIALCS